MVIFKIKQLRRFQGWTLAYLSELTGISISQLQRIENNETMPTFDKVCDIAHAFGVPIDNVYEYIEKPQP